MVNINLDKRAFFVIALICLLVVIGGFIVFAYGGNDPKNSGHSSGEIMVKIDGSDMKLQDAIDNGELRGENKKSAYLASYTIKTAKGFAPSPTQCPEDWNHQKISDLIGSSPSNFLYIAIGHKANYLGTHEGNWIYNDYTGISISKDANGVFSDSANDYWLCWKEFDRKMYVHLIGLNTVGVSCPSGYRDLNVADLERKDGNSFFMANEGGFFLGGLSGWWAGSNGNTGKGEQDDWWGGDSTIKKICMKIYESNVFPMTFIMKDDTPLDATGQKSDFSCYNVNDLAGIGSNYIDTNLNDNSYFMGGSGRNWNMRGDNALSQNLLKTSMAAADGGKICFKFYSIEKNGYPAFKFRTTTGGDCSVFGTGFIKINNIDKLERTDNYVHMHHTPYGAFIGGIYEWNGIYNWNNRDGELFRYRWLGSQYANSFCYKFE
ncbi:MAG: hypothetical protein ACOYT4_01965 [Nanoarchaeota archaeon]